MKSTKNLHVPLSDDLHGELRRASASLGRPATSLVREAIEAYLRQLRRQAADAAIHEWAVAAAGTELDLDRELESAALEFLASRPDDASR